jgi:hypothetical protein
MSFTFMRPEFCTKKQFLYLLLHVYILSTQLILFVEAVNVTSHIAEISCFFLIKVHTVQFTIYNYSYRFEIRTLHVYM